MRRAEPSFSEGGGREVTPGPAPGAGAERGGASRPPRPLHPRRRRAGRLGGVGCRRSAPLLPLGRRPRAPGAGPAARGAAAPGDGKVPGASADMPGSDTALTVDRTYSDPGRRQRCKRRVSGADGVCAGAERGARPRGLRLPRGRTPVPHVPLPPRSLPGCPASGLPRPCPRRRGWEGGGRNPAGGSATPGAHRPRGTLSRGGPVTPRRPPSSVPARLPGTPGLPDGRAPPRPPPGGARRTGPCGRDCGPGGPASAWTGSPPA